MMYQKIVRVQQPSGKRSWQQGLTLIELLVSIVLMGLVTLGTVTLYSATSQSYKTIDSSQGLNDSARYAFEVIGQSLRIAGYQEYMRSDPTTPPLAGTIYPPICTSLTPPCPIIGFNNSKVVSTGSVDDYGATNNGGLNFSDTLGITFSGSSIFGDPATPDRGVVDCQGVAQPVPLTKTDLGLSLFWVTTTNGEPELACISRGNVTAPGGTVRNSQAIVRGVETFQVMYGVNTNAAIDSLPNKWVSAQDVTDWMKVRAVRVGFVLRGMPGSSQNTSARAADRVLYPLGQDFIGTSTEPGLAFIPPVDGRIRRAYTSTYMLRNTF
jgi:type IV pilus assembly protein PilW